MYWINVKFVAPSNENLENVLRYSMTNKIKLIYRPQSLSHINIENEVKTLKWSLKNGNIVITNNTPFSSILERYFLIIVKLKIIQVIYLQSPKQL